MKMKIVNARCNCTKYMGNAHSIPAFCRVCGSEIKQNSWELQERACFPFVVCDGKNDLYKPSEPDKLIEQAWICIYEIDGTIIDVREWEIPIFCEKCGLEIEEEAIAKDRKPYHYNCSGVEL